MYALTLTAISALFMFAAMLAVCDLWVSIRQVRQAYDKIRAEYARIDALTDKELHDEHIL